MVFFLYKCYYVFFLFFSKNKHDAPWNTAIVAIATSTLIYILTLLELLGILDILLSYSPTDNEATKKGKMLLFIGPLCIVNWYAIEYIIFRKAKASKKDGRSEQYVFNPTKRDKMICWLACFLSLSCGLTVAGINALLK